MELAVADDTAEGALVCFDGVMARLHKLRASEASQMLVRYEFFSLPDYYL